MAKKKQETTELVEKKEAPTELAEYKENPTWGTEDIGSEDIVLPRLMLMQSMSELVQDGKATAGQWRDSLNSERIIADKDKEFDVIIFGSDKKIMRFKNNDFEQMEDYRVTYPYEESDENGNVIKRQVLMNYYCLLMEDIAAGEAFPYVLSFRSTATRSGRILATNLKKLQMLKKPSAARVFTIGIKQDSNDKGKWFVPTITMGRATTQEEMDQAYDWYKGLMSQKFDVHAGDIAPEEDDKTLLTGGVEKPVGTVETHGTTATAPSIQV